MLKVTIPKISLIILISAFCLHLSGLTVAEECWDREGGGPTFSGNYTYPPGWFPAFQYDPDNPDEIDRNSSVTISVIGGFPPYTWSVSGNGFSIPTSTPDRTNTLSANDTACGTATIEVTDTYGASVTGYVRCTEGQWVPKGNICQVEVSGYNCAKSSAFSYDIFDGNKKWHIWGFMHCCTIIYSSSWGSCSNPPPCGSPEECATFSCDWASGRPYPFIDWSQYYEWECP